MANTLGSVLPSRTLASDEALRIARADAETAYHDLNPYRIEIMLEADGWHIAYEPKDATLNGAGPHYVIDAATGAIVSKKYYQ
ncbi:hypothetical protein R5W24_000181 [Gemmata sp. JC717]|uniref:PepSY domain-containing protein n=1 Tax=Gemmata algarum TaxID=2975278 RepID=A0ABU5F5D7_9BACT|nr:hypothetical protein [Gemmata algarum]MDY3551107.1 hypothetical protein [Gemmata algarum]MDY3561977.1 hypothetical protein [Gemmata algarum]